MVIQNQVFCIEKCYVLMFFKKKKKKKKTQKKKQTQRVCIENGYCSSNPKGFSLMFLKYKGCVWKTLFLNVLQIQMLCIENFLRDSIM